MSENGDDIDWSKTTFDGSRREQLRRWRALTLQQRLEALDGMLDLAKRLGRPAKTAPREPTPSTQMRRTELEVHEPPSAERAAAKKAGKPKKCPPISR